MHVAFMGSDKSKQFLMKSQTRERRRGLIVTKQGPLHGCDRFAETQARDVRTVFVPREYRKLGIPLAQGVRCLSRRVPRLFLGDLTKFLVYTTAAVNLQLERTCFSFALAIPKQSERSGFRYSTGPLIRKVPTSAAEIFQKLR